MTSTLDGGPIFMKCPLSLEGSTAEEIYVRASKLSCELALRIIDDSPIPRPQTGEPTEFKRRKPKEGSIHNAESLEQIHDFIRMLDADGYPPAFLEYGGFRLEFRRSSRYHDRVVAEVTIRRPGESS
jgi:methionyl-tRNA formyltransferase